MLVFICVYFCCCTESICAYTMSTLNKYGVISYCWCLLKLQLQSQDKQLNYSAAIVAPMLVPNTKSFVHVINYRFTSSEVEVVIIWLVCDVQLTSATSVARSTGKWSSLETTVVGTASWGASTAINRTAQSSVDSFEVPSLVRNWSNFKLSILNGVCWLDTMCVRGTTFGGFSSCLSMVHLQINFLLLTYFDTTWPSTGNAFARNLKGSVSAYMHAHIHSCHTYAYLQVLHVHMHLII